MSGEDHICVLQWWKNVLKSFTRFLLLDGFY